MTKGRDVEKVQLPMLCFGDRVPVSPPYHLHAADGALELSPTLGRHGKAMVVWSMDWFLAWSKDSSVSPGLLSSSAPCPVCAPALGRGHYKSLPLGWTHQQVCKALV